jgi:hypothetical protein
MVTAMPMTPRIRDARLSVAAANKFNAPSIATKATSASKAATAVMLAEKGFATPKIASRIRADRIPAGSATAAIPNAIANAPVNTSFHQFHCSIDS